MNKNRIFVVIFLFQVLYLFGENAKIKPDTVVLCYFGSGDGQVGIEISDMQYGPFDFAIDERGNVYVSDYYNNRVIKFDSEGNVLRYFYPPEARWISVYKDRLYIGDGNIWVYDTSGNLIKELKGVGYPRVDKNGNLCAYFVNGMVIFDKSLDTIARAYKPFPPSLAQPLWSGDKIIYFSSSGYDKLVIARIQLKGEGNVFDRIKSQKIIRWYPYAEKIPAGWIEGEDMYGNIYIQGHEKYRDDVVIFVKLSPEGEFLGQLEVDIKTGRLGAISVMQSVFPHEETST
jgi:outer membrane protein assembly factor BamB